MKSKTFHVYRSCQCVEWERLHFLLLCFGVECTTNFVAVSIEPTVTKSRIIQRIISRISRVFVSHMSVCRRLAVCKDGLLQSRRNVSSLPADTSHPKWLANKWRIMWDKSAERFNSLKLNSSNKIRNPHDDQSLERITHSTHLVCRECSFYTCSSVYFIKSPPAVLDMNSNWQSTFTCLPSCTHQRDIIAHTLHVLQHCALVHRAESVVWTWAISTHSLLLSEHSTIVFILRALVCLLLLATRSHRPALNAIACNNSKMFSPLNIVFYFLNATTNSTHCITRHRE